MTDKKLRVTVTLKTNKKIAHRMHVKEKPVTESELALLREELERFTEQTGIPVSIKVEDWID